METKDVFISINGIISGGAIAEFKTYREASQFADTLKRKARKQIDINRALEALAAIFATANDPTGFADPPLDDISELARAAIKAAKETG